MITDSGAAKLAIPVIPDPLDPNVNSNPENPSTKGKAKATSKPANEVITDSVAVPGPSACEPYREAIDSAMLDRLLHHGHVLKCGPRSWRTKTDLPPQEAAG